MSVWALLRAKDEADIIEATVRHTLHQVDHVLVADNLSTDGTYRKLQAMESDQMTISVDQEVGYYQSAAMSQLAEVARLQAATWVISVDADELWLGHNEQRIADILTALPPEALIAEATVLDHVAVDGHVLSPWRREAALPLRKVACRAREGLTIHQGNHGVSFPEVDHPLTVTGQLEVHHYPYRSAAQFVTKARNGAAAYAATDLDPSVGAHWRSYGQTLDENGPEALHEHFYRWFHSADPEADGLVFDPV